MQRVDALAMVTPMVRLVGVIAVAAMALTAGSCGRKPAERAESGAVQTLLASAWLQDDAAFETVVDRPLVRADLRRQLSQLAAANDLAVDGGASDAALDRMITPHAFRLVDSESGMPLNSAPTRAQAAALLKPLGDKRVCVHDQTPEENCLLTFAKVKDGWRLVAMAPAGFTIVVTPEPAATKS